MVLCLGDKTTKPPAKFLSKIILNGSPDSETFILVSIEPISVDAFGDSRGGWDLDPTEDVPKHAKKALEKALSVFCGAN